jgi:hypothetical protein
MLQFPLEIPPGNEVPPLSPFESLVTCILLVWMAVMLVAMVLPRPWFVALFRAAFPFMPEKLEDLDDN